MRDIAAEIVEIENQIKAIRLKQEKAKAEFDSQVFAKRQAQIMLRDELREEKKNEKKAPHDYGEKTERNLTLWRDLQSGMNMSEVGRKNNVSNQIVRRKMFDIQRRLKHPCVTNCSMEKPLPENMIDFCYGVTFEFDYDGLIKIDDGTLYTDRPYRTPEERRKRERSDLIYRARKQLEEQAAKEARRLAAMRRNPYPEQNRADRWQQIWAESKTQNSA